MIEQFSSLGVGGVLAGMIFYFYRRDRKVTEELAKDFRHIVEDNSRAITRLCELLEAREFR